MKSEMVWTRTLIYTLVAVLAAQLKLSPISGDFIISIGVIVLALFTWFDESMPVKRVIVISAVGIFLTRITHDLALGCNISATVKASYPEVVFYLVYGIGLVYFQHIYSRDYNIFVYI